MPKKIKESFPKYAKCNRQLLTANIFNHNMYDDLMYTNCHNKSFLERQPNNIHSRRQDLQHVDVTHKFTCKYFKNQEIWSTIMVRIKNNDAQNQSREHSKVFKGVQQLLL